MNPFKEDKDPLPVFEDLADFFDYNVENIRKCTREWTLFSKICLGDEPKEVSWEILKQILEEEFNDQYEKTIPIIKMEGFTNFIFGFYKKNE